MDNDLATRLRRSLTAGGDELFAVIQDPDTEVLQALLRNPSLGENHLLALLQRPELSEELLIRICKHPLAESSHRIKVALVHHPAMPAPQLMSLLPQLYIMELATLCTLPHATADQKLAAERAIIQRLPSTPLGYRITLARRGTAAVAESLLKEGDSRLIEACLDNPHLKEGAVYQFLKGGSTTAETISAVARHPRWQGRKNLRLAILGNPRTPTVWHTLWLPTLSAAELKKLAASPRLTSAQRREVTDIIGKRH